jgi:hypothetical protein
MTPIVWFCTLYAVPCIYTGVQIYIKVYTRDDNLGMITQYMLGNWSYGYRYRDNFLPVCDTRTRSKLRRVWNGYFFSPVGNLTGTQYFTIAIILVCEQVKMCLFCYIFLWEVHFIFIILTMTYFNCWTLLLGYLKYLLNINFEYVYIVLYSLN